MCVFFLAISQLVESMYITHVYDNNVSRYNCLCMLPRQQY